MKLKHEYGFFASLLVLFVIIGISSAFFIYERKLLIQDLKEREKSIYNSFSEMSKESLSLHDELLLLNYMSLTKKINKEIVYMLYESPDGHLLSVPKSSELKYLFDTKEKLSDESNERILFSPEGIEINELAKLIYLNGKANGEIRIGFSQDILRQEVKKTLRTTGERL